MSGVSTALRPPGAAALRSHILLLMRQRLRQSKQKMRHVSTGDSPGLCRPTAFTAAQRGGTGDF